MTKNSMTAGEVLDALRINPSTLKNWERRKILIPMREKNTQWRIFSRKDVDELKDSLPETRKPGRAIIMGRK